MGATIPLGMFAIRNDQRLESRRSFSFLYLANVLGAVAGALIPLLLIELWGFGGTLQFGMLLNLAICGAAYRLAGRTPRAHGGVAPKLNETPPDAAAMSTPALYGLTRVKAANPGRNVSTDGAVVDRQ